MNEAEARTIAEQHLDRCVITLIEDHGELYAILFVNEEYYRSKDITTITVGAGPMFIEKSTGRVFQTGSGRSVSDYLTSYRECGDLYGRRTNILEISGLDDWLDKQQAILSLKNVVGYSMTESKGAIEKLLESKMVRIEFSDEDEAMGKNRVLSESGFVVRQLWDNQC